MVEALLLRLQYLLATTHGFRMAWYSNPHYYVHFIRVSLSRGDRTDATAALPSIEQGLHDEHLCTCRSHGMDMSRSTFLPSITYV